MFRSLDTCMWGRGGSQGWQRSIRKLRVRCFSNWGCHWQPEMHCKCGSSEKDAAPPTRCSVCDTFISFRRYRQFRLAIGSDRSLSVFMTKQPVGNARNKSQLHTGNRMLSSSTEVPPPFPPLNTFFRTGSREHPPYKEITGDP